MEQSYTCMTALRGLVRLHFLSLKTSPLYDCPAGTTIDTTSDSVHVAGYDKMPSVLGKSKADEWRQFAEDMHSYEGDEGKYVLCCT